MSLFRLITIRIVLLIALFPAMLTLSLWVRQGIFEVYGRYFFKYTYIEVIDTPTYKDQTKKVLEEFNSFGDNKIISFKKINNGRPVQIREMTDLEEQLRPDVLGSAWPSTADCNIRMKKKQDPYEYRETLIHEYLHCFGYNHVPNPRDIMYFQENYLDKEDSIRQYAKKVLKKYYE